MSDMKITINLNGPLKVVGNVKLLDHDDNQLPTKDGVPIFLCRCGASQNKPFCDGAHKRVGFEGS